MSTNKNKFNTSKNTKGWFPFAKFLFVTDNHPIRQSKDKCSSNIKTLFSQQEVEQIRGIVNSLQCEERDALRIALYETSRNAESAYKKTFEKAKTLSTVKGHEGRKYEARVSLPVSEKKIAEDIAAHLGITIKEFFRLSIVWLADGIKEESITSLSNSKRIGKDAVAKQWSRENRNKPPSESVKKLKEAQKSAQKLLDYEDDSRRERERSQFVKIRNPSAQKFINEQLRYEEAERSAEQSSWESKILEQNEEINDFEFLIRCKMREYNIDYKLAKWWVEDDSRETEMLSKMTSKEKLEFLKKEREEHKQIQAAIRERADKKFQEAFEQNVKENSFSIDADLLEQRSKDMEASRIIYTEETKKDMEDYKNEPLLWDEQSDGELHQMMNQAKDTDE